MLSRERDHCDRDQKSRQVFSLIEEIKSDLVQFDLMLFWEGDSGGFLRREIMSYAPVIWYDPRNVKTGKLIAAAKFGMREGTNTAISVPRRYGALCRGRYGPKRPVWAGPENFSALDAF